PAAGGEQHGGRVRVGRHGLGRDRYRARRLLMVRSRPGGLLPRRGGGGDMSWASAEDTLAMTGVQVTEDLLAQAQGVIDVFSGVTEGAEQEISARNRRLLRSAVAYQAAWMVGQIDVMTRTDVSQLRQDGSEFTAAHPDSLVLAPLAKRCLDRLSWRGARSRRVR